MVRVYARTFWSERCCWRGIRVVGVGESTRVCSGRVCYCHVHHSGQNLISSPCKMEVLFDGPEVTVHVHSVTGHPRRALFEISVRATPDVEHIDRLATLLQRYLTEGNGQKLRVVIKIRHVDSERLAVPNLAQLLCIVRNLVDMRDLIDERLLGTVIQARGLDESVDAAQRMFFDFYKPRKPLRIVTSNAACEDFVQSVMR